MGECKFIYKGIKQLKSHLEKYEIGFIPHVRIDFKLIRYLDIINKAT